jgi:murein DD-endopeptidase MepM/ murein hydrolase activator NlpD
MSAVRNKAFVFSPHRLLLYLALATLVLSWILVAAGGYVGIGFYHDYLQLREKNAHLIQKKQDLDELKLAMKRIQKREALMRNVLGLEEHTTLGDVLHQGGAPITDLSSIAPEDFLASSSLRSMIQGKPRSILDQAKHLQDGLHQLVEAMRERQEFLDSTPSILPVETENYWFTSGFGWRRSPFTGLKEFHDGLDISAPMGTPIIAPGEGRVVKIGRHRYRGNYLQLTHGRRRLTTYAHLSRFNVTLGQNVKRGEVIAYMGSTGRSTGSHLHYEIAINGRVVNPKYYILNAEAN